MFCTYCLVFLCIFISWLGCIQHWWYWVSSSLLCILTLSLDGGVNVHYNRFIRWSVVSLRVYCVTIHCLGCFLLNYVVISNLIYVLLCLTVTSVCVMCLWHWISAVFFMWVLSVVSFSMVYFILYLSVRISLCSEVWPVLGWRASGMNLWKNRVLSSGRLWGWGFMAGGV